MYNNEAETPRRLAGGKNAAATHEAKAQPDPGKLVALIDSAGGDGGIQWASCLHESTFTLPTGRVIYNCKCP